MQEKTIPIQPFDLPLEHDYNVQRIMVIFGLACNLHCRYCSQARDNKPSLGKRPSDRTIAFIQRVSDAKLSCENPIMRQLRITLYGGEPLLYFKQLKELVTRVGLGRKNIRWGVLTNGTLLNDEMVDFFNAMPCRIILSHDGPNTSLTRGINVLDDPKIYHLYRRAQYKVISSVVTAYNQDLYALKDYLDEKIGFGTYRLSAWFFKGTHAMAGDLLAFDLDAWQKTCDKMAEYALREWEGGIPLDYCWEMVLYRRHMKFCDDARSKMLPVRKCGLLEKLLGVDMDGNVYMCADICHGKVGTVETPVHDLWKTTIAERERLFAENRKDCMHCPCFDFCQGGCVLQTDSPAQRNYCGFLRIFYKSVQDVRTELEKRGIDYRDTRDSTRGFSLFNMPVCRGNRDGYFL